MDEVRIGLVSISDRASAGVYEDKGIPALQDWLGRALKNPIEFEPRLIPDEQAIISQTLIELVEAGWLEVLDGGGGRGKATEYRYNLAGKPPNDCAVKEETAHLLADTAYLVGTHPLTNERNEKRNTKTTPLIIADVR